MQVQINNHFVGPFVCHVTSQDKPEGCNSQ